MTSSRFAVKVPDVHSTEEEMVLEPYVIASQSDASDLDVKVHYGNGVSLTRSNVKYVRALFSRLILEFEDGRMEILSTADRVDIAYVPKSSVSS